MTETALDNQALVKRSLLMAGVMVGSCVLFVGTLTLTAVAVVSHAVSPPEADTSATQSPATPAATARAKVAGNAVPAAPVKPSK